MAEEGGIDVLMKVVVSGGSSAIAAESKTVSPLLAGDAMVADFLPGQFCELTEFDFSAGAEGSLSKHKAKTPAPPPPTTSPRGQLVKAMVEKHEQRMAIEHSNRERLERREQDEVVDMREVSYERILDVASPVLFKALTECTTLASITIVKRKAAGTSLAGMGYLRLDFDEVLMTELDWKDKEHVMMESGSFIYRKLTMVYLSQTANGTLVPGSSATWTMKTTQTGT